MNEPDSSSTFKFKRPPVDPDDLLIAKLQAVKAGISTKEWIGLAIRNQAAVEQAKEEASPSKKANSNQRLVHA